MVKLSVNINKIATLRNSRGGNYPDLLKVASDIQNFGADGITVHPRPDQRHIRYEDAKILPKVIFTEYNIEGNPIPEFIDLVKKIKPSQVTLVPDSRDAITSNSGWNTVENKEFLKNIVSDLKSSNIRTSIFINPIKEMVFGAKEIGTDRIELFTENYAKGYGLDPKKAIKPYLLASEEANKIGLGINAGHDLNLENIEYFAKNIPNLLEVSIGHAVICESIYLGLENVIPMYLNLIK